MNKKFSTQPSSAEIHVLPCVPARGLHLTLVDAKATTMVHHNDDAFACEWSLVTTMRRQHNDPPRAA